MRTGGWCSDIMGEVRVAEAEVIGVETGTPMLTFKGGRFALGYPLGMPVGVDGSVSFQVYVDGELVEATGKPVAMLRLTTGVQHHVEVLGVSTHLRQMRQGNVLTHGCGRWAELTWPASESEDVSSYRVYDNGGEGAVDYERVSAEVEAAPGGVKLTEASWRSGELSDGIWRFGVRAVDQAGNEATSPVRETEEVTVSGPPLAVSEVAYEGEETPGTVEVSWTGSASFN